MRDPLPKRIADELACLRDEVRNLHLCIEWRDYAEALTYAERLHESARELIAALKTEAIPR